MKRYFSTKTQESQWMSHDRDNRRHLGAELHLSCLAPVVLTAVQLNVRHSIIRLATSWHFLVTRLLPDWVVQLLLRPERSSGGKIQGITFNVLYKNPNKHLGGAYNTSSVGCKHSIFNIEVSLRTRFIFREVKT